MLKKFALPLFISVLLIVAACITINDWRLTAQIFYLDKIYHFTGGVLAAWLVDLYFGRHIRSVPKFKRLLIIVSGACAIGVAWELAEWLSTAYAASFSLFLAHYMGIGTLADTIGDLAIDTIGALVYGVLRLYRQK